MTTKIAEFQHYNIAQSVTDSAKRWPYRTAIIFPVRRGKDGRSQTIQYSFKQFEQLINSYARGFAAEGIGSADRILMLVPAGPDMIAMTFALMKLGAVPVLIDPGMGIRPFLQCVTESEPTALVAIPLGHLLSRVFPKPFKRVSQRIVVGSSRLFGGKPIDSVRSQDDSPVDPVPTSSTSEAAIVFTSGSTGIPKGVIYEHGMFEAQLRYLQKYLGLTEGHIDMPGLLIFALFNPALGVTTVIPDMDFRKPAQVNPAYLVEAIETFGVTSSFGSPTIWKRVGNYCIKNGIKLPSLQRIFMAGAPAPPELIEQFEDILVKGQIYTPFGATEALPVTTMHGSEIVTQTGALTKAGYGVCIGRPLDELDVRVIDITDDVIERWEDDLTLPQGEVGEIVVKGDVVTKLYLNRPQKTAEAKIYEDAAVWHRMGDMGYFDEHGRLWMVGRKAHRVDTANGRLYPVSVEAIFNAHPQVSRSALVGLGERGKQEAVLIVELVDGRIPNGSERANIERELLTLAQQHEHTKTIARFLFHKAFPVDVRHNVKIQREKLAAWAEKVRN